MKILKAALIGTLLTTKAVAQAAYPDFACTTVLLQPFPTGGDQLTIAPESGVQEFVVEGSTEINQGFGWNVLQKINDPLFSQYALTPSLDPNNFALGVVFSRTDDEGKALPVGVYSVTTSDNSKWPSAERLVGPGSFALTETLAITGVSARARAVITCLKR